MALFPCTSSSELVDIDTTEYRSRDCPVFDELCSRAADGEEFKNSVQRRLRKVMAFRKRYPAASRPQTFEDNGKLEPI